MQLSLSCSAQASQLIQSRPSRAGTKPELINLPKPIWVLQRFLGTCSVRSGARTGGGLCAQLCLALLEWQLCWRGLCNTQSSGEQAETPRHPEGSSKGVAGLKSSAQAEMPAVPALILRGCLQSSLTGKAVLHTGQAREQHNHTCTEPSLRLSHARHTWASIPGSLSTDLQKPMENRKATAKWRRF